MTLPTAGSLRDELARAEQEEQVLRRELQKAQQEVVEARDAGTALLSAVEAAMEPLMRELVAARQACGDADLTSALSTGSGRASPEGRDEDLAALEHTTACSLEAEIRHLELDIGHCHEQLERLHLEERQRNHERQKVQGELTHVLENLSYEKQRARHNDMKKQLWPTGEKGSWAGLGPSGLGRRTMEVRSELALRKSAEDRTGKITRDLTRLALDTSTQQSTIEQLERRLVAVRKCAGEQDVHLQKALHSTTELHRRLRGEDSPMDEEKRRKKKKSGASSTGRLPHLSF